jgi:transposase-like protein
MPAASSFVPTVICPGCKTQMQLMVLAPSVGDLHSGTYRCVRCGTETTREFKPERNNVPAASNPEWRRAP